MYTLFMSFDAIEEKLKEKLQFAPEIGAKLKLDFGNEGILFIDGTQTPPVMSHNDGEADTTFQCSTETFAQIVNGSLDPTMAFMTGKMKVHGSMGYALKVASMLED
ncbi:MAG: SCP-2 sterol transfer family protein [Alphaproteobacteria bacterium]|nr:SCP-2 sterol transfer family protein [Alphaproteobacteria bacterium]